MSAIKIYKCVKGTCYKHAADNRYLGKFLDLGSRARNTGAGAAGQTRSPIYIFEKEEINDNYPADMVIPVTCMGSGGKRKVTKKTRRNRRSHSRCK